MDVRPRQDYFRVVQDLLCSLRLWKGCHKGFKCSCLTWSSRDRVLILGGGVIELWRSSFVIEGGGFSNEVSMTARRAPIRDLEGSL